MVFGVLKYQFRSGSCRFHISRFEKGYGKCQKIKSLDKFFTIMIIWILLGLLLFSLVLPFIWLIKLFFDNSEWKYNLLRALYGNISGLILIGATWTGHQYILTESPDFSLPSYLSFLFLLPVVLDIYKTEKQNKQLKRLLFYSALGLGIIFNLLSVLWQLS